MLYVRRSVLNGEISFLLEYNERPVAVNRQTGAGCERLLQGRLELLEILVVDGSVEYVQAETVVETEDPIRSRNLGLETEVS